MNVLRRTWGGANIAGRSFLVMAPLGVATFVLTALTNKVIFAIIGFVIGIAAIACYGIEIMQDGRSNAEFIEDIKAEHGEVKHDGRYRR